jgi:hypothetical protein
MMKPRLRIAFADYHVGSFRPTRNFIYRLLAEQYELQLSERPDVLFYSCFGRAHRRYLCRRVFFTGELRHPNWRECDYALTYDHLDHPDHYRLPNFAWGSYGSLAALVKDDIDVERILAAKTRFCNFVYSNPDCPQRNEFFDKLSRYRRVDAPGAARNNMQGAIAPRFGTQSWVKAKMSFIAQYKFTIAFENESHPGYTTEKLPQSMWAESLPIYWGNPLVHLDFNRRSFINFPDHGSLDSLVERVIEVDRNDDLYAQFLREPWLNGNQVPASFEPASIQQFLVRIVETPRQPAAMKSRSSWFSFWKNGSTGQEAARRAA